jgi:hypothetical protein
MKTKNEIVDRLYKAGYITLEEVLVLMEKDYIQTPQWYRPYDVTCDSNPKIGENSCLSGSDINEGLVKYKQ